MIEYDEAVARLLPAEDPSLYALDAPRRYILARHWEDRARAEETASCQFAQLVLDLFREGAAPTVLAIVGRAVGDELRHAELCRLMAQRCYGAPLPWMNQVTRALPSFDGAPQHLRTTLRLVAVSSVSETIAAAWLQASLAGTTSPLAAACVRELLRDDVTHARAGFAHLASRERSGIDNGVLTEHLPEILDVAAAPWLHDREFEAGVPEHGFPSRATSRAVVVEAIRDLLLPGLASVGVDPAPGHAWLARTSAGVSDHEN